MRQKSPSFQSLRVQSKHLFPNLTRLGFRVSGHCSSLCSLQSRSVVWLISLISDILGVDDSAGWINHKDGTLEETPLFEPHPIVLPKLFTALGRERLMQHTCALLEARLHLWRVHAYG